MKKTLSLQLSHLRWSRIVWWCILLFSVFSCTSRWKGNNWQTLIDSDGTGYYSYLPATFIYHDYSYGFIGQLSGNYKALQATANGTGFCNSFNGKYVNKYFCGEAVALAPFFLAAHLLSGSAAHPADGYSFYYMAAVSLGAIFYLSLGLWAIRILLLRSGIREAPAAIVLLCIFFATNLSHYALDVPSMSHVYSFGFISCFVLQAHRLFEKFTARRFLVLCFLVAMITLIRPLNILVVLSLPFIAGNFNTLKLFFTTVFRRRILPAAGAGIFLVLIFIQLLFYHAQCGKWLVYSYNREGFDFLHPHFFDCLFSYSNGMFVYAPVLFIALTGLFTFLPGNIFRFFSFLIFFCIVNWAISSWWAWTYSGAFGMRPFVEYYVFFALLLGFLVNAIAGKRWIVSLPLFLILLSLCVLCQLQIWQYKNGIIGYGGMTKEKYWRVFLQTRRQFYYINIEPDGIPPVPPQAKLIRSEMIDYETRDSSMDWRSVTTEKAFSGTHSICLRSENNHAPHWKSRLGDIFPDSACTGKNFISAGTAKWYLEDNGSDARMVLLIRHGDSITFYNEMYIIHQVRKENKWTDFNWNITLPVFSPNDTIELFPRRDNWFPVYIDDLKMDFYNW